MTISIPGRPEPDDGERDDAEADTSAAHPRCRQEAWCLPWCRCLRLSGIENLLAGIPGQQFRLLHAVEILHRAEDDGRGRGRLWMRRIRNTTSVYGSAQVVQLLERDGARSIVDEDAAHAGRRRRCRCARRGRGFISVAPAPPCRYRATQAGLDAVAAHVNEGPRGRRSRRTRLSPPSSSACLEMREGGCAPPRSWTSRAVDGGPCA